VPDGAGKCCQCIDGYKPQQPKTFRNSVHQNVLTSEPSLEFSTAMYRNLVQNDYVASVKPNHAAINKNDCLIIPILQVETKTTKRMMFSPINPIDRANEPQIIGLSRWRCLVFSTFNHCLFGFFMTATQMFCNNISEQNDSCNHNCTIIRAVSFDDHQMILNDISR